MRSLTRHLLISSTALTLTAFLPSVWAQPAAKESGASEPTTPAVPTVKEAGKGQKETGMLAGDREFVLMVDEEVGELNLITDENNEAESIQAKRGVIFTSEDMTLNSDEFEYNTKNSQVIATGKKVVVRMGEIIITCQSFRYNPETQEAEFDGSPIVYNRGKDGKVQQTAGKKIAIFMVNGKTQMKVTGGGGVAPYIRSANQDAVPPAEQTRNAPGQKNAVMTLDNKASNRPSGNVSEIVQPRPEGDTVVTTEGNGRPKPKSGLLSIPAVGGGGDAAPAQSGKSNRIDPNDPKDIKALSSEGTPAN